MIFGNRIILSGLAAVLIPICFFGQSALPDQKSSTPANPAYLWPTESSKRLRATFGAMRPRRYHAGLDINTNGALGYEVYAIADGYIERVRVSTSGYGKAIYLRLSDGNIAVYAHLREFMPTLGKRIRRLQEGSGRYALDRQFGPTEFPVRTGDVIGSTGDTGSISGPHLHFELRDSEGNPINPMTHGFSYDDGAAPEISRLAIIPLTPLSDTNGNTLPTPYNVRKVTSGEFVIDDTIGVKGPFGLAVEAYDRAFGEGIRLTIQGASLVLDGVERYRINFERYSFSEDPQVEVERDYYLNRRLGADFHRLFSRPWSRPSSFIITGSDQFEVLPGYHPFTIKVWDNSKNLATLKGILANTPPTRMDLSSSWSPEQDGWIVTMDVSSPLSRYDVFAFDIRGREVENFSHRPIDSSRGQARFLVPYSLGHRCILQISAVNRWGTRTAPGHLSLIPIEDVTRPREFTLNLEQLESGVIFQLTSDYYLPVAPELLLHTFQGVKRFRTIMVSPTDFLSPTLHLDQVAGLDEIIVRVDLDPAYEIRIPTTSMVVLPDRGRRLTDPSETYLVDCPPGTFYDSTLVWIQTVKETINMPAGLLPITAPVRIGPLSQPLKGGMKINIKVPAGRLIPDHAGIFYLDKSTEWVFMTPDDDQDPREMASTRTYSTIAYSGEVFALLEENDPPIITDVYPGRNGRYRKGDFAEIRFKVFDRFAGLKDETAINVTLDGTPLIFEYNTYRQEVNYKLPRPLNLGAHQLEISAVDNIGNTRSESVTFHIR